jgi:hypothetical protein
MTILTSPGAPGNPLDAAAIAAGIFPFDLFTSRPITLYWLQGVPGHLLPDLIDDIRDFIPAAELALRKEPRLAGLALKHEIDLMVQLSHPGSHVRDLIPNGLVPPGLYEHLLFVPLAVSGVTAYLPEFPGQR